jgi:hypothetical protein
VIIVFFNEHEMITCDAHDEQRVKADFFKMRDPARFKRVAVGDYAYVRATAPSLGGNTFSEPRLLITTNLSDHKL